MKRPVIGLSVKWMLDTAVVIHFSLSDSAERTTGHNTGPVGNDPSGNPFVLKDPASSGQAVGPGLFTHTHDQQHATPSIRKTQAGFHSGGPFASITWRRPVPLQASGAGLHHFQLAGTSQFTGANPFSPSVPGRSHSMDDFLGDRRGADQNRQAHSAPIVPELTAASHFQFPSKKTVQFYLPRIKVGINIYYFLQGGSGVAHK